MKYVSRQNQFYYSNIENPESINGYCKLNKQTNKQMNKQEKTNQNRNQLKLLFTSQTNIIYD